MKDPLSGSELDAAYRLPSFAGGGGLIFTECLLCAGLCTCWTPSALTLSPKGPRLLLLF